MSVTQAATAGRPELTRTSFRIFVALVAIAAVTVGLALLAWLVGLGSPAPSAPPKSPFGTGIREAAPTASGFGGWIMAAQSQFNRAMTAALESLKSDGAALWSLLGLGFLYGVFHAAGPGHGKGVISAYLIASRRTLAKGLGLSFAAAFLQAAVAITLISVLAIALRATAASIDGAARAIELASFAIIALVGLVLVWRKTAELLPDHHDGHGPEPGHGRHRDQDPSHPQDATHHHSEHRHAGDVDRDHVCDELCGHAHIPPPSALARVSGWRESGAVVVAAGIRPCSGAIILLVFALSQGLYAAGILATLAMALGTALTTGTLAALAVFAKKLALRFAGADGSASAKVVAVLEVLAAAFVFVLGATLLLGLGWKGSGGA